MIFATFFHFQFSEFYSWHCRVISPSHLCNSGINRKCSFCLSFVRSVAFTLPVFFRTLPTLSVDVSHFQKRAISQYCSRLLFFCVCVALPCFQFKFCTIQAHTHTLACVYFTTPVQCTECSLAKCPMRSKHLTQSRTLPRHSMPYQIKRYASFHGIIVQCVALLDIGRSTHWHITFIFIPDN